MTREFDAEPVDTMAGFVEAPQWRPMIVTRFEPRLVYVGADGRQVALRLSEADLWELGREVAAAIYVLRSTLPPCRSAAAVNDPPSARGVTFT